MKHNYSKALFHRNSRCTRQNRKVWEKVKISISIQYWAAEVPSLSWNNSLESWWKGFGKLKLKKRRGKIPKEKKEKKKKKTKTKMQKCKKTKVQKGKKTKKTKGQKDKLKRQKDRSCGKHVWTVGRAFCAWILPFSECDAHVSCLATRIAAKNPTNGKFLTQQCSFSCNNPFKARSEAVKTGAWKNRQKNGRHTIVMAHDRWKEAHLI